MKNIAIILIFSTLSFVIGFIFGRNQEIDSNPPPALPSTLPDRSLEKYEIERLQHTDIKSGHITTKKLVDEKDSYKTYLFEFEFAPNLKDKKTTTGILQIPQSESKHPIIVMIRGFISQESYQSGMGTKRASDYFAENGFITIAPDFLGYAESDKESSNIFESRFQTYVTVVSLLKTVEDLRLSNFSLPDDTALEYFDQSNIFLWGHSNGGQVVLTALEITGKPYPTTLWAPVSRPFPYSILYYTDESADNGKLIRRELAKFEENYDVDKYSFTNYLDKIVAPILLHQGEADDAIPVEWSTSLVRNLRSLDKDATYYTYPETDHDMRPAWDIVVERDVEFFKKHLEDGDKVED